MRIAKSLLISIELLLLNPCIFAQSAAPIPTFKTGTTNVIVDVVVTGSHDLPIDDLLQQNFEVLENGHPQQVVSLTHHPSSSAPLATTPAPPPGVFTNAETVGGDSAIDVLLLDALNTATTDQAQAHKALIQYLKTLPLNQPVAIFTLDTQLHQLADFSTDHAALLKVVDAFARTPQRSPLLKTAHDTERDMKDEDDLLELGLAMKMPAMGQKMMLSLKQFNTEQDSYNTSLRVQYTLSAMNELARYLYGMPGRKNLLWLSGSFPLAILPDNDLGNPTKSARDFMAEVDHTSNLLAGARVAVYPIDARGLFPQPLAVASISGGSAVRNTDRSTGAESAQLSQQAEERNSMEAVARATGGKAIYNTNDLKGALAEVDQGGSHYYTVAYIPSDKSENGKRRSIEVRVHPGKYHLAYRRSYSTAPIEKPDDNFRNLLQHNVPASTQIVFRLTPTRVGVQPATVATIGSNPKVVRPVTRYTIAYDIDAERLGLFASAGGVLHGSTTMVTIAYDRDGKALNSVSNALNLNVPSAQYSQFLKQGIQFKTQLDLPPQTAWIRAGIFDSSLIIGSLEIPFSVPSGTTPSPVH